MIASRPIAEDRTYVIDIIRNNWKNGQGNPRYLVGMSGAELADLVVTESGGTVSDKNDGTYTTGPEYWAGWVLAYYPNISQHIFHLPSSI